MSRKIVCKKLNEELDALEHPPFPGPLGERIHKELSAQAWQNWMNLQTKIVNEYRLDMHDQQQRDFIMKHLRNYFFPEV